MSPFPADGTDTMAIDRFSNFSRDDRVSVLLIYRSANLDTIDQAKSLRVPVGLFFLAAYLDSKGIAARVVNFSGLSLQEQRETLKRLQPAYVGLSMLTMNRISTLELVPLIKKVLAGSKIVLGGPHASFLPVEILKREPEIDCVVCGEGEETFWRLIRCWETDGQLSAVKGVAYRQDDRVSVNPPRPYLPDLSVLPHPASCFAYEDLTTSRGCPYRCGFCSSCRFWGEKIRFHSAKWVVDEIELLYRKHGIRDFGINDDIFTVNRSHVIGICKEIVERGLFVRFRCMSRVNTLCPDRLEWLKRAGCYQIDFGVESGSERQLKAMGKKADIQQAVNAFRMTRNAGIRTGCFLIVGYPGEDDQSIADTKHLLRKLRPDWCDLSSMAIFPGSPVYRQMILNGQVQEDIWFTMKDHTLFLVEDGARERYLRYLNELRTDYEKNKSRYAMSASEKKTVLERFDGLGHAALEFSRALADTGNRADALKILNQAVQKEPQNPFLWHEIAQLCLKMENRKLALSAVEKALTLQVRNYESLRLLARISASLGEVQTAAGIFRSTIENRPEKIEARLEYGEMLQRLGRYAEAAEIYSRALIIDPYWRPLKEALQQCETEMRGA